MRVRTRSACVVLAWGILLLLTAAGPIASPRPAQATTRIASTTTSTTTTRTTTSKTTTTTAIAQATLTSSVTSAAAAGPRTAIAPDARAATRAATVIRADAGSYVVQPGDTLSGIATALAIPGGWQALYAANRPAIGPDPGLIRPGTVLALPDQAAPGRYRVTPGDTLSGIAAALAIPGGWPALYAANRQAIGPDPDAIQAGTILAIPRPTPSPTQPAPRPAPPASTAPHPAPAPTRTHAARPPASAPATLKAPASAPAPTGRQPRPRSIPAIPTGGLPRWLEIVLVAAGLLIATAFLTDPALAIARRRRTARSGVGQAHIVLADYERLVVTHSSQDGTVYVLRPPGADPRAILLAARLVLAQDRYEELAGHLGVPAHWSRE